MENDTNPPRNDDSPAKAATQGFLKSFSVNFVGFAAFTLLLDRLGGIPFRQNTWARIKDSAAINTVFSTVVGLWDARKAYNKAHDAEKSREFMDAARNAATLPLMQPPCEVMVELAHTQQALDNVSHELEVVTNRAASFKPTADTHAEQAAIAKAAAERESATIH